MFLVQSFKRATGATSLLPPLLGSTLLASRRNYNDNILKKKKPQDARYVPPFVHNKDYLHLALPYVINALKEGPLTVHELRDKTLELARAAEDVEKPAEETKNPMLPVAEKLKAMQ